MFILILERLLGIIFTDCVLRLLLDKIIHFFYSSLNYFTYFTYFEFILFYNLYYLLYFLLFKFMIFNNCFILQKEYCYDNVIYLLISMYIFIITNI